MKMAKSCCFVFLERNIHFDFTKESWECSALYQYKIFKVKTGANCP